ncbi:hypothetical protein [Streptomyces catenulae]|uniref:Uncharacterized protein n=1 Tax=Streptomyces catenulae TaxID=66875 RepID=A0ABV2YTH3_9ACTN|nr:hypothetical protein [Streptomyces catenulae]
MTNTGPVYPRGTFVTDHITRRTGSLIHQYGDWLFLSRGIGIPWTSPAFACRAPSAGEAIELATALTLYTEAGWMPPDFPPPPPE